MSAVKTYEEIVKAMTDFVEDKKYDDKRYNQDTRRSVFLWIAEYSETNHNRMVKIAGILENVKKTIDEDGDEIDDITDEQRQTIFQVGLDIHNGGGRQAQQSCFYVAVNFFPKELKSKIKDIQIYWDGAGDWRY
jgi:hypothetical protein